MRISDWSSDVCSSDLGRGEVDRQPLGRRSNHHIAIPGIAIAPRVTRKVERRPDLRGRRLRLFEIGLAVGEPRLEPVLRSEEHTSELQSLMRISYAVFCLNKKKIDKKQ